MSDMTIETGDLRLLSDLITPLELNTPDGLIRFQPDQDMLVFEYGGVRFKLPWPVESILVDDQQTVYIDSDEPAKPFPGMIWIDTK